MILLTFETPNGLRLGIKRGDQFIDVSAAVSRYGMEAPTTMDALLRLGFEGLPVLEYMAGNLSEMGQFMRPLSDIKLGPAVTAPGKIICVGLNYRHHAIESGMEIPREPILFSKFANTIAPGNADIDISGLRQVDYEAELGVVVGRQARHIEAADALDHVLGYCNANDLSDRELQFKSGQWLLGKTIDGFLPNGPWLRTAEAGFDAQRLDIRGWLNGELRQDSNTSDMIFPVTELIAYISSHFSLEPGDLIVTGTPMGVILGREEKDWIQPGDEYTVEISGLGRLTNQFTSREIQREH